MPHSTNCQKSLLNWSNYKVYWKLSERICNRNLYKFDTETHHSLILQAVCHQPAALHLLLVGDVTAESPEGKTGSKELGTDNANYWIPLQAYERQEDNQEQSMHIIEVTSCLIAFYNELSGHMDDGRAVDVIYLNFSNIFTIFTTAFSLENQGVMS